ncbi:MAG: universal stress protein [Desulfobacterales bacterium]|jgi:nucleotide-binding universal stress UspA family protein
MELPKIEVKKILYATDLSESARRAFAYAVSLANLYQAKITFLHVMSEDPNLDSKLIGYIDADKWEEIKRRNEEDARSILIGKQRSSGRALIGEALGQFCEAARAEQDFRMDEIVVKRGNPVDAILAQAEESNCDLIVMGTHGHGVIADAVMGSTARRVLRKSRKPVLVVRLLDD